LHQIQALPNVFALHCLPKSLPTDENSATLASFYLPE
jgi:hypothetical protein